MGNQNSINVQDMDPTIRKSLDKLNQNMQDLKQAQNQFQQIQGDQKPQQPYFKQNMYNNNNNVLQQQSQPSQQFAQTSRTKKSISDLQITMEESKPKAPHSLTTRNISLSNHGTGIPSQKFSQYSSQQQQKQQQYNHTQIIKPINHDISPLRKMHQNSAQVSQPLYLQKQSSTTSNKSAKNNNNNSQKSSKIIKQDNKENIDNSNKNSLVLQPQQQQNQKPTTPISNNNTTTNNNNNIYLKDSSRMVSQTPLPQTFSQRQLLHNSQQQQQSQQQQNNSQIMAKTPQVTTINTEYTYRPNCLPSQTPSIQQDNNQNNNQNNNKFKSFRTLNYSSSTANIQPLQSNTQRSTTPLNSSKFNQSLQQQQQYSSVAHTPTSSSTTLKRSQSNFNFKHLTKTPENCSKSPNHRKPSQAQIQLQQQQNKDRSQTQYIQFNKLRSEISPTIGPKKSSISYCNTPAHLQKKSISHALNTNTTSSSNLFQQQLQLQQQQQQQQQQNTSRNYTTTNMTDISTNNFNYTETNLPLKNFNTQNSYLNNTERFNTFENTQKFTDLSQFTQNTDQNNNKEDNQNHKNKSSGVKNKLQQIVGIRKMSVQQQQQDPIQNTSQQQKTFNFYNINTTTNTSNNQYNNNNNTSIQNTTNTNMNLNLSNVSGDLEPFKSATSILQKSQSQQSILFQQQQQQQQQNQEQEQEQEQQQLTKRHRIETEFISNDYYKDNIQLHSNTSMHYKNKSINHDSYTPRSFANHLRQNTEQFFSINNNNNLTNQLQSQQYSSRQNSIQVTPRSQYQKSMQFQEQIDQNDKILKSSPYKISKPDSISHLQDMPFKKQLFQSHQQEQQQQKDQTQQNNSNDSDKLKQQIQDIQKNIVNEFQKLSMKLIETNSVQNSQQNTNLLEFQSQNNINNNNNQNLSQHQLNQQKIIIDRKNKKCRFSFADAQEQEIEYEDVPSDSQLQQEQEVIRIQFNQQQQNNPAYITINNETKDLKLFMGNNNCSISDLFQQQQQQLKQDQDQDQEQMTPRQSVEIKNNNTGMTPNFINNNQKQCQEYQEKQMHQFISSPQLSESYEEEENNNHCNSIVKNPEFHQENIDLESHLCQGLLFKKQQQQLNDSLNTLSETDEQTQKLEEINHQILQQNQQQQEQEEIVVIDQQQQDEDDDNQLQHNKSHPRMSNQLQERLVTIHEQEDIDVVRVDTLVMSNSPTDQQDQKKIDLLFQNSNKEDDEDEVQLLDERDKLQLEQQQQQQENNKEKQQQQKQQQQFQMPPLPLKKQDSQNSCLGSMISPQKLQSKTQKSMDKNSGSQPQKKSISSKQYNQSSLQLSTQYYNKNDNTNQHSVNLSYLLNNIETEQTCQKILHSDSKFHNNSLIQEHTNFTSKNLNAEFEHQKDRITEYVIGSDTDKQQQQKQQQQEQLEQQQQDSPQQKDLTQQTIDANRISFSRVENFPTQQEDPSQNHEQSIQDQQQKTSQNFIITNIHELDIQQQQQQQKKEDLHNTSLLSNKQTPRNHSISQNRERRSSIHESFRSISQQMEELKNKPKTPRNNKDLSPNSSFHKKQSDSICLQSKSAKNLNQNSSFQSLSKDYNNKQPTSQNTSSTQSSSLFGNMLQQQQKNNNLSKEHTRNDSEVTYEQHALKSNRSLQSSHTKRQSMGGSSSQLFSKFQNKNKFGNLSVQASPKVFGQKSSNVETPNVRKSPISHTRSPMSGSISQRSRKRMTFDQYKEEHRYFKK